MAEPHSKKQVSQNRIKLLLVTVLSVVLLYVIFSQSEHGPVTARVVGTSDPRTTNPLSLSDSVKSRAGSMNPAPGSVLATVAWPATPLADVLAINPFKLLDDLKPVGLIPGTTPTVVESGADLAESQDTKSMELRDAIKSHRLKAIVKTPTGIGAIVGDAVIGVGDVVGNRLRVTEIRPIGVVFELIEEPIDRISTIEK